MNASYKLKLTENQKSVTCEVVVEGDNKDEVLTETKDLYEKLSNHAKMKTLQKNI